MEESTHIMEMLDTLMIPISSYMGIQSGGMSCKLRRKKDTMTLEEGTSKVVAVTVESQLSLCPMTSSSTLMKPGNCGKFSVVLTLKMQVHGLLTLGQQTI